MAEPGIYIISGSAASPVNLGDCGYYGLSVHAEKRLDQHLSALRRNEHKNEVIQDYYNLHGKNYVIYDIVEDCDVADLGTREKFYIARDKTFENPEGWNLTAGGEGVGVRGGKPYYFQDASKGIFITGQNLSLLCRLNPQFELQSLYRLSRGEILSYGDLTKFDPSKVVPPPGQLQR